MVRRDPITCAMAIGSNNSLRIGWRRSVRRRTLHFSRMEVIIADGLPRFLQQFLARLRDLGERIACDFLVPPAEAETS